MDLNQLAKDIFEGNKSRGFHDKPQETGTYLMLMVSELGEALEAHRIGRHANDLDLNWCLSTVDESHMVDEFKEKVKDTHEDEIADTLIRILDYCGLKGIDIQGHMEAKLRYNATRPHKHGKAY